MELSHAGVAPAAIRMQVPERGARGGRGRDDARRRRRRAHRESAHQPPGHEPREIDRVWVRCLGMRRIGIAVGRELQRGDAEHVHRTRVVTGAAIDARRNRVSEPVSNRHALPDSHSGASTASVSSSFHT